MKDTKAKPLIDFLEDKPFWAWLLVYLLITGALFGIFRLVLYLLGIVPWIGVLVLLAAGLLWGTIQYSRYNRNELKDEDISSDNGKE